MNDEIKGQMIRDIIFELKMSGRDFDEGDTFFSLCFKSDKELTHIHNQLKLVVH